MRGHVQSDLPQRCFGPPQLEATLLRQAHLRKAPLATEMLVPEGRETPSHPSPSALSGFVWPRLCPSSTARELPQARVFSLSLSVLRRSFREGRTQSLKTPRRVSRRPPSRGPFRLFVVCLILRSSSAIQNSRGCTSPGGGGNVVVKHNDVRRRLPQPPVSQPRWRSSLSRGRRPLFFARTKDARLNPPLLSFFSCE